MAKVTFTKLGLKVNQEIKTVNWNEQMIEVKQYLPINDKLGLISDIINSSADNNNFANPVKIDVFFALYVIEAYTNITFTDKQKEDPCKIYDSFVSVGLWNAIVNAIPEEEYGMLMAGVHRSVDAIYEYKNSVLGILESVSTDYSNLDLDATNIQQKLADPNNMALLRDVLSKLG